MTEKTPSLVAFLRKTTVFNGIPDDELSGIAATLHQYKAEAGELLCEKDAPTEGFFFILDGEAAVVEQDTDEMRERLMLKEGDFAGEEAIFFLPTRRDTVIIKCPSTIIFIANRAITGLLQTYPQIRQNVSLLCESRSLSQKMAFSWLVPDEEIHVISRKHPILLLSGILLPVIFYLGVMLISLVLANTWPSGLSIMLFLLSGGFVISLAWLVWNVYNWSNDYYILTNQRMVWIEKVAGVFDSRQEAPLITLKTVGTSKSMLGNLFDYADVTVRTFVGPISFRKVANAELIAGMIQSLWQRSKQDEDQDEYMKMEEALKRRFSGEAIPSELATEPSHLSSINVQEPVDTHESNFFEWLFGGFLKLRFEKGGIITYRKHWLILLKQTWLPLLVLTAGLVLSSTVLLNGFTSIPRNFMLGVSGLVLVVALGWLLYNYVDWRNDNYQLSDDQVVDVDRKPLGKENRRAAPLESILSIEYKRKGILAILFNYGTVLISVGMTELSFDYVSHPSEVQQDIFARMGNYQEIKRKIAADQERERISQWLKVYDDQADTLRRQKQPGVSANEATRRIDYDDEANL